MRLLALGVAFLFCLLITFQGLAERPFFTVAAPLGRNLLRPDVRDQEVTPRRWAETAETQLDETQVDNDVPLAHARQGSIHARHCSATHARAHYPAGVP